MEVQAQPSQETQILYVDLDNHIACPYDLFPSDPRPPDSADASIPVGAEAGDAAEAAAESRSRRLLQTAAGALPLGGADQWQRLQQRRQERLRRAMRVENEVTHDAHGAPEAEHVKEIGAFSPSVQERCLDMSVCFRVLVMKHKSG